MKKTVKLISALLVLVLSITALSSCGSNSDSLISFKMSTLNPWLKNDFDAVAKVEEIHTYYGIAPNQEMRSYYSVDKDVIADYMEWCGSLKLVPTFPRIGVAGGGSTSMVFTFADGSTKIISTKHGVFYTAFLLSFNMHGSDFDTKDMDSFYRFNVSDNSYSIYTYGENPTLVKEAESGAEDLGFVRLIDAQEPSTEPTHYLEASFGTVYIYSDTLCYIDTVHSDEYLNGYCEIYGTTFSELMK